MRYSIILPCRNEERALGKCIQNIKKSMSFISSKEYEIIVSDSSNDNSASIAKKNKVKLVKHNKKGYGIACLEGAKYAKGKYLIFMDADGSYNPAEIPKLINNFKKGYKFVIGNRFKGKIGNNAMPLIHRYIGNPILSSILRLLFKANIQDSHCGLRAIEKKEFINLKLQTTGMEFASEMIVKSIFNKLKIKEVPVNYYKRIGKSKLSSFSDGWRHLRFMFMYAPNYSFLLPGLIFFFIGILIMILFRKPIEIWGLTYYSRPLILGSFFTILGYQIITLGIYTKTYMKSIHFVKSNKLLDFIASYVTFELGIFVGMVILLISFGVGISVFWYWVTNDFPGLTSNIMLVVLTLAILGLQTMFSALFLSILLVEKK